MTGEAADRLTDSYVARLAGLIVVTGGGVVLAGWMFDVQVVKQLLAGGATMEANTALALALAGAALRAQIRGARLPRILGFIVALIGGFTLAEIVLGWNLGIDELLFRDRAAQIQPPGQMAPATAFCFVALGLALAVPPQRFQLTQPLVLAALFVSAVAVVGYLYDVQALYSVQPYTTMAVHSAALLVVLAIGVLWRDPPAGIMAVVRARDLGGLVARRLLLITITAPLVFGWLRSEGQRAHLYGTEFGVALLVVLTISLMSAVVWSVAKTVGTLDAARQKVVKDLGTLTATLEDRVANQTAILRAREAELQLVTEKALDAFVAIDAGGRICDWNREAERLFGWTRSQVFGLRISDVIIPERYRDAHLQGLNHFLATGQGALLNRRIEVDALHRDGHEMPVEMTISPVQVQKSWRFNAFIRDVSRREPAQRPL